MSMDVSEVTLIGAVVAQIITFLGVVVAGVLAYVREGRARRWQLEDRGYIVSQQAKVTTEQTMAITAHTAAVVGEATDAAHAAYKEANDVNLKIERLGLERVRTDVVLARAIEAGVQAEIRKRDKDKGPQ